MHNTTTSASLDYCHKLTNPYLHQFSSISSGNCITPGVDTESKTHLPPAPHPTRTPPPDAPTTPTSPQPITTLPYNLCPCTSRPHYAAPITHNETCKSMEYRDLLTDPSTCATWLHSAANEFGRLSQGLPDNRVEPTNTIFFIPFSKVPKHKRPTSYCPQKAEPYHTRITVGGNLIDYPGNLSMKVADMTTFKILMNSTLSTPGARWLGLDVKNYYLGTPMDDYEYMFIPINSIPKKSSRTTNSKTLPTTERYIRRSAAECMVFPKLASLLKNN